MKKTAAIDTWKEIRPTIARIAAIVTGEDVVRGDARP
jgi:hypothetical protein